MGLLAGSTVAIDSVAKIPNSVTESAALARLRIKIIKNAIGNMRMRQPPALLSIIFPVIHFLQIHLLANNIIAKIAQHQHHT